ncbi:nuclear transcription factor Y subunit beta-like [Papaver somniferum]|uniref:nuclear transcription factor Y subunit beta-like n=1 Tax=Papaver somniferum TaxID=3469 RepID=UPI000E6FB77C|nr:nuclear transcription factor Y subunit beta-like [Papaver somniferum]
MTPNRSPTTLLSTEIFCGNGAEIHETNKLNQPPERDPPTEARSLAQKKRRQREQDLKEHELKKQPPKREPSMARSLAQKKRQQREHELKNMQIQQTHCGREQQLKYKQIQQNNILLQPGVQRQRQQVDNKAQCLEQKTSNEMEKQEKLRQQGQEQLTKEAKELCDDAAEQRSIQEERNQFVLQRTHERKKLSQQERRRRELDQPPKKEPLTVYESINSRANKYSKCM